MQSDEVDNGLLKYYREIMCNSEDFGTEKHQYPALFEGVVHMLKTFPSFPQPASREVVWQLPCACICEKRNEACIYYLSLLLS